MIVIVWDAPEVAAVNELALSRILHLPEGNAGVTNSKMALPPELRLTHDVPDGLPGENQDASNPTQAAADTDSGEFTLAPSNSTLTVLPAGKSAEVGRIIETSVLFDTPATKSLPALAVIPDISAALAGAENNSRVRPILDKAAAMTFEVLFTMIPLHIASIDLINSINSPYTVSPVEMLW